MWLAQSAHFLLGVCAMTLPFVLWGKTYAQFGSVLIAVYGGIKEPLIDPWAEDDPFIWSGLIDLSFLLSGTATAWTLYFLVRG